MITLITGGAGYIGSHTVRELSRQSQEIIVLDNLVYGHRDALIDPCVTLIEGDLGDESLVRQLFQTYKIGAVIHFAAYAYVGESMQEPLKYYENNLAKPLVLLKVMREVGCHKFIFSSTCATYGEPANLPITEDTPQKPINPYGQSKLMLEQVLQDCDRAWGLKSVVLRYFNACGASHDSMIGESHDPETHLIPLILETALGKRDHIKVFGTDYDTPDGTCIRDYIHVVDLADAHLKALEYLNNGNSSLACNLGTGAGYSVQEVIDTARTITKREITATYEVRRPGDPPSLVADPSQAGLSLNWTARNSSLHNIIASAWAWYQNPNY